MSLARNHHYISRFLTKPWEDSQCFLRYYDFHTNRFGRRSPRSLFAEEQINSPGVERWLNRMAEDPFAKIRDRVVRGEHDLELEQDEYRAALLLVVLQGGRVAAIADVEARQRLDELAAMSEPQLEEVVMLATRTFHLRVVPTATNAERTGYAPLYMPSTGLFCVVVPELAPFSSPFGFGIPIAPSCALLATPAEWPDALDLSQTRRILSALSIGASTAQRVVVLPGMYEQKGEGLLRELLLQARRHNEMLISTVRRFRPSSGLPGSKRR
jgi:hypothetical protein